jgi:hypothetical protein
MLELGGECRAICTWTKCYIKSTCEGEGRTGRAASPRQPEDREQRRSFPGRGLRCASKPTLAHISRLHLTFCHTFSPHEDPTDKYRQPPPQDRSTEIALAGEIQERGPLHTAPPTQSEPLISDAGCSRASETGLRPWRRRGDGRRRCRWQPVMRHTRHMSHVGCTREPGWVADAGQSRTAWCTGAWRLGISRAS